jgi:hypothetical protein
MCLGVPGQLEGIFEEGFAGEPAFADRFFASLDANGSVP